MINRRKALIGAAAIAAVSAAPAPSLAEPHSHVVSFLDGGKFKLNWRADSVHKFYLFAAIDIELIGERTGSGMQLHMENVGDNPIVVRVTIEGYTDGFSISPGGMETITIWAHGIGIDDMSWLDRVDGTV